MPQTSKPSKSRSRFSSGTAALVVALLLSFAGIRPTSGLTINLTFDPDATFTTAGLTATDIANMKAACAYTASLLTAHFTDNVNVNIAITAVAGTGTLGGSSTSLVVPTYANMRTKLLAEVSTPDDVTATGAGGSVPASDPQPAAHWFVSRAQGKALGLIADNAVTIDGTFTFGGGFSYTYDPFNRAVAGKHDFIGVALHEFTEIMGRIFVMGENLDGTSDYILLDLFHFTSSGVHGFSTGAGRYFSIDNGATNLKNFNNFDLNGGDAQDYASGVNDAFNAFGSSGVRNDLTEVGLRNMDVIGYNRLLLSVALDATNLTWTTAGNNPWLPQSTGTHDGVDAAKSGGITNSQSSYVEASVSGPVNLSFWWKVSSETGFDFLTVTMDGFTSNSISGEVPYTLASLSIPAGVHTVRWTYSKDGSLSAGSDAAWLDQVTTSAPNVAPVLAAIEVGALPYAENQAATAITATLTATDSDSPNLASGSVSITANFASGQDVLAMNPNPQNGITAVYSSGTGVLSLSGSSSVANYQAALRSVTYANTSESPSTSTRTVTFLVNDGALNSNSQARNITVTTVNDAPVLANIEAGALSYAPNQVATAVTASITAADVDNANLASASVSITAGFVSGQDVLAMSPNPQNGITAAYTPATGVLGLSGSSSVANYQTALRSVTYVNSNPFPAPGTRTVSFVVNDGATNSNSQARNINVSGNLIPPPTLTNGGISSILLFVPDASVTSAFKSALDFTGRPYQYFTDATLFNNTVSTSAPSSTLVIVDSIDTNPNFANLISFVANGGRSILYYWDLDQNASLAAAFNATVVQDIFTPVPIRDWSGSYFFSQVSNPLPLFERGYNDDGDKLQPTPGGVAVAGHTAAPTNGQACVIIGNSGRTILNSMALQDATNAPTQAAQFALNEIYYLLSPLHRGGRVALLAAEPTTSWNDEVRQRLLGTGAFEAVDVFQADTLTPTLAQLQSYSAVMAYSDTTFNDSTSLGNVLADYVDAGGGVVVSVFALYSSGTGYSIDGRLLAGGYLPFVPGTTATAVDLTLVPDEASHPILAGVTAVDAGTTSFHNVATLAPNSELVAHWSNGRPLVMTKLTGQGRVVGLNMFPPSQISRSDFWRTNTDGARLMANALLWSGLPECSLQTNYAAGLTFNDSTISVTLSLAFDGTNFWSASGNDTSGNRLARYSAAGVFVASYAPGIDFRSLFTDSTGRLFARGYNSPNILRQTTPGTFVTHVTLSGGSLDSQAAVVLNGSGNQYVALSNGVVSRWNTSGTFLGSVSLAGFGTLAGENAAFQNVRLAAVGNVWLTYNNNRVLSVWDQSGVRIATTTLQNAGVGTTESGLSISYCAGKAFVNDFSSGPWRGYDICTSPARPYLYNPLRQAGGQFQFNLHASPARVYVSERTTNFVNWVPVSTNLLLAPNATIVDPGAGGNKNLYYRSRTTP